MSGGALIVEPERRPFWSGRRDALVVVTMPTLEGLEASSGARIEARGVNGGALELEGSSGAVIEVFGDCASLSVDASSGSRINAAELRCQNGRVDVSSGAHAYVHATGRLDVDASSGGEVIASGSPASANIERSSGGRIRREG